jgi:hypothetical protein
MLRDARRPVLGARAAILMIILLFGCSSRPVPPTPEPHPSIACGDLATVDCVALQKVVLAFVHDKRWLVTSIEMGKGTFCAVPGHLFDHSLCPPVRPSGAQAAVGHALISLSGTSQKAYLNMYVGPNGVITQFIDLATPPPSPS